MTARVILKRASRANWLKHRRDGLGGTDVAAVLGFNRWATPLDVWLDKTGRSTADELDTYPVRRGTFMEPYLLAEYARTYPLARMEKPPALLAHPEFPFLRASLDGLAHHPEQTVIVEAKTAGWRSRTDWWDEEALIPDAYAIQVLHYLMVTQLDEAHVVADIAGDFTTVTIARDLDWEAAALPLLADWWGTFVVGDTPPPADWERDTIPALNRAWVPVPGESVEAAPMVAAAVKVWQSLSPAHRERGKTLDALRVQIREGMGTAQTLTIGGHKAAALDSRGILRVTNAQKRDET
jgi:putative phage-type endonuclease